MKEKRTILGYIRHAISGKPEIAFPEVRAWLTEPGNVIARPNPSAFPDSGKVFLHARAAFDSNPLPDHYGIFECQQSDRPKSAAWEVFRTDDSICQVVSIATSLESPLDFYTEVETGKFGRIANTFCGNGRFFLLTRDGWVIGPYLAKNGTVAAATERTLRWKHGTIDLLYAGEFDFCFVSARSLSAGTAFPPTLQDAIRRTLKLISRKGRCSFLSRPHIGELAEEMAIVAADDDLSWFATGMNQLLPIFQKTLEARDELANELLGNQSIGDLLEARWRGAHLEKVEQEESRLKRAEAALQKTADEHGLLLKTTTELAQRSEDLQTSILSQKTAAHDAFQAEISRLAADPAQVAILSSLFSRPLPPVAIHASSGASSWTEIAAPASTSSPENGSAIVQGLLNAGLSIRCAHDVATVARAAFVAGQAVSIKCPLAALFAEALLFGSGHSRYWACEVPAGLLEAIPCPTEKLPEPVGLLFHGANRSDYNLVLAAFRLAFLKQNVGGVPTIEAVLTLDGTEGLVIDQELPAGPCIGPEFLNFADAPKSSTIRPFSARTSAVISPITSSEFEGMFPQAPAKVPFFQNSFSLLMARKYCAALKSVGCEPTRVKELFLKYWLLPRLSRPEVAEVLKGESALCHADAGLAARLSSCLDE